ncbi:POLA4 [Auxenochlorella protothecoides x Auxenochlorella symbiontica]
MGDDRMDTGPSGRPETDQGFTNMGTQEMMKLYYGWIFPYRDFYKWLAYGNDSKLPQADAGFMQRREFCFTLDGDIFVRYQSFKDLDGLQAAIKERCPSKLDIGPVYNINPARRAAYAGSGQTFTPVERELVFDIDLTDYDDVRTCGSGGHICNKCWPLMAVAIQILDAGLRRDFGFQHILYVYSGRRGVHAWVCDDRARCLSDEQRAAVANYFAVYRGQEGGLARLALGLEEHPAVTRAAAILEPVFVERLLPEQGLLSDDKRQEALLAYIPSERVRERARQRWAQGEAGDDVARWHALEEEVAKEQATLAKARDTRGAKALDRAMRSVVFAHAYPRLDLEVSKKMNHLLKAPFCVHPKTGKVCVPIDPDRAHEFDPETVVTVGRLLDQLNKARDGVKGSDAGEEWRSTDLVPAIQTFRACFLDGLQGACRESLAARARESAAQPTLVW